MRLLFYRFFCCEIKSLSVRRLFPEIAFLFLIAWNGEARIFTYRKKLLLSVLPPRYFFPSPNMYQPKVFFFFFFCQSAKHGKYKLFFLFVFFGS